MIVECPACQLRHDLSGRPPGTRARCRCGTEFALPEPPAEAAGLACPGCGAPARPDARSCGYCGSALATARCPRCFALLFRGVKHCAACGAAAEAPAQAAAGQGDSSRRCPRCSPQQPTPLVAQLVAATSLDQCARCGGLWVDQSAFERLTEAAESGQSALAGMDRLPRRGGRLAAAAQVTYLRCPDCDKVMNRRNYGRRSGVIVDVCSAHGIWFDDEELTRVLEFVRSGGLDETRRREKQELREERRRLESQKQHDFRAGRFGSGGLFAEDGGGEAGLFDVARVLSRLF